MKNELTYHLKKMDLILKIEIQFPNNKPKQKKKEIGFLMICYSDFQNKFMQFAVRK